MLNLTHHWPFLCGLALLSGILSSGDPRLVKRSDFAEWRAAEDEMAQTLSADTAIDSSGATLAGLQSAMQQEGALKGSIDGLAVVWWQGAVNASFQAHPLVRYLPAFIGRLFLAPAAVATRIHLRFAPQCEPQDADASSCEIRWERSRFPGTLFGLSPGIDHEEALRRLSLDPQNVQCIDNATWVEDDPAVLARRACEVTTGTGWSLTWHEDGQFQVASISASRNPLR